MEEEKAPWLRQESVIHSFVFHSLTGARIPGGERHSATIQIKAVWHFTRPPTFTHLPVLLLLYLQVPSHTRCGIGKIVDIHQDGGRGWCSR